MNRFFLCRVAAVALSVGVFGTLSASAGTMVFTTAPGATTSGPVNAEADFTTTANSLSITIKDFQANPGDVAQLPSAIFFTISNGSLTSSSANNPTVNLINISGGTGSSAGTGSAGWVYTATSATAAGLDDLVGTGHAGPAHLIIGPGPFSNAGGSINGNGAHNPFIDQMATWIISGAGITADTVISTVTLQFGTTDGSNRLTLVGGGFGGPTVPELDPSASMSALTCLGLGLMMVRRRVAKRATV